MSLDPVALAIPVFFGAMALEAGFTRRRGYVRFDDGLADLACGVMERMLSLFLAIPGILAYDWVYTHARFFTLDHPLTGLVVGVVAVDFMYYWLHRAGHRTGFYWAFHEVHHQSTEYNLAVALRQPALEAIASWPFALPIALLGVPTELWLLAGAIDLLYQFWIHTRAVGRLGPLEWVFNTPSHHRVHHAVNRKYLDKNYGGIFIVFDRMFGTFAAEDEAPIYGTITGFRSWDPLRAHVEPWVRLAKKAAAQPGFGRVWAWFAPPEWGYAGAWPTDAELAARPAYHADFPEARAYVLAAWVPISVGTTAILALAASLPKGPLALAAAWMIAAVAGTAAVLERRRGFAAGEIARWIALPAVTYALFGPSVAAGVAVPAAGLAAWAYVVGRRARAVA